MAARGRRDAGGRMDEARLLAMIVIVSVCLSVCLSGSLAACPSARQGRGREGIGQGGALLCPAAALARARALQSAMLGSILFFQSAPLQEARCRKFPLLSAAFRGFLIYLKLQKNDQKKGLQR